MDPQESNNGNERQVRDDILEDRVSHGFSPSLFWPVYRFYPYYTPYRCRVAVIVVTCVV